VRVALRFCEVERVLEIPGGVTIADAAKREGFFLLGSCNGQGKCGKCSRYVRKGLESLLQKDGTPYQHQEGCTPYVKTCQVTVTSEGVSINGDDCARRW
jgi:ferredoxin